MDYPLTKEKLEVKVGLCWYCKKEKILLSYFRFKNLCADCHTVLLPKWFEGSIYNKTPEARRHIAFMISIIKEKSDEYNALIKKVIVDGS